MIFLKSKIDVFSFSGEEEKQLFCLLARGLGDPLLEKGEFTPEFFLFILVVVVAGEFMD